MDHRQIGDFLVTDKKISLQELERALYIQKRRAQVGTKPLLGTVLLENGWVNLQDLEFELVQQQRDQCAYTEPLEA